MMLLLSNLKLVVCTFRCDDLRNCWAVPRIVSKHLKQTVKQIHRCGGFGLYIFGELIVPINILKIVIIYNNLPLMLKDNTRSEETEKLQIRQLLMLFMDAQEMLKGWHSDLFLTCKCIYLNTFYISTEDSLVLISPLL